MICSPRIGGGSRQPYGVCARLSDHVNCYSFERLHTNTERKSRARLRDYSNKGSEIDGCAAQ